MASRTSASAAGTAADAGMARHVRQQMAFEVLVRTSATGAIESTHFPPEMGMQARRSMLVLIHAMQVVLPEESEEGDAWQVRETDTLGHYG